jgi:hypothetical protein
MTMKISEQEYRRFFSGINIPQRAVAVHWGGVPDAAGR